MPARKSNIRKKTPRKAATKPAPKKALSPRTTKTATIAPGSPGAAEVATYLRDLDHPLKTEIEAARLIILGVSPKIAEGIKWNVPSFRTSEWFATFNIRARDAVQLIFHLGAKVRAGQAQPEIADPKGLMKWLGKDRAMVTLGAGPAIAANSKAFEAIVRAWIKHV